MRALLKDGCSEFATWVLSLDENPSAEVPLGLLTDEEYSYEIPNSPDLNAQVFSTKYELASTLFPIVIELEALRVNHDSWPGIWSALALFYFESICNKNDDGWAPRSVSYYVYGEHTGHKPKFYAHRIYGPITLYRTAPECIRPFFEGRFKCPAAIGQFEMSIGASNELAENPTILEVLRKLYVREDGKVLRFTGMKRFPGSTKKWDTPGGIRRIPKVCRQLRRTYDLHGVSTDSLLELLPTEFHDWLGA